MPITFVILKLFFLLFLTNTIAKNSGIGRDGLLSASRLLADITSNNSLDLHECINKFNDNALSIHCTAGKNAENCEGQPDIRLAWLNQCLSRVIVKAGFQLPVYVVHGPDEYRLKRIKSELTDIGLKYVHIHNKHQASHLNTTDVNSFFIETHPNMDVNSEEYKKCIEVHSFTNLGPKDSGPIRCSRGVKLDNRVLAVGLEHFGILTQIANCQHDHVHCASLASAPESRYALIFEDDQHIPKNIIELVVEVLIQSDNTTGMYMLDDSWFWLPQFFPLNREYLKYVYQISYERNYSRTVGAYLINQQAARKLVYGGYFYPQRSPIDFQLNYAVIKENISVHWVFPPMTCAGSAGMNETSSTGGYSIWPEFRDTCNQCCNKYYDVNTMNPYLKLELK